MVRQLLYGRPHRGQFQVNKAVAYGEEYEYGVYEVVDVDDESTAIIGEKIVVSIELLDDVKSAAKILNVTKLAALKGTDF